jgi:hypothetical protein
MNPLQRKYFANDPHLDHPATDTVRAIEMQEFIFSPGAENTLESWAG